MTRATSRFGGVARGQLGGDKYTSHNLNLKAFIDIIAAFASVNVATEGAGITPEVDKSLLEIDVGGNIGFAYMF